MQRNDSQLVLDYLNGDEEAFALIVSRYIKPVYNFVFRLCGNREAASDIVQEVFLKVWKNLKKFDPQKNFKTWIFTIARNTTIDWLRKKQDIIFSTFESPVSGEEKEHFENTILDLEPLPDEIFVRKELAADLEKALSKIRPDFMEIIILHYIEELTFDEISKIVGKPLNTVKSHHLRALHQMRLHLRI